jgi:putative FmdB family regulatory protein
MPIYEYECQNCKRRTEAIQRVGEKPLKICPHCGGALKKLASAPAIQFKGSGWYVTDYARTKTEEKSSEPAKTESSDKAAEKPAEKPAETPAQKKKEKKAKH